ncbi:hypothetical protein ACFVR1_05085 [Psychrobacillus sp. NPDC058041]|uniref:hypothetical protein n=1 Tax=Psychrobacillus sp. NPDC058041 TaxID=3346310 RepID=UPI0036DE9D0C
MKDDDLNNAIEKLKIENIKMQHISKIGEGAWHNVYRIERNVEEDLVLRIRKKKAYGQLQAYKDIDLITEYESSKVYYHQANQCSFNICPSVFDYFHEESVVFTVESFMGKGKILQCLSHSEAFAIGEKLGEFFKVMHRKVPELQGFGNIIWNGKHLEGQKQQEASYIWQKDNDFYLSILNSLTTTDLTFNREIVVDKILNLIENRRKNQQKISLVNQDVTPENIIFHLDKVSLIDPFPRLDFDLKYAGYFVFCYKFLLPIYSNASRYQNHEYNKNSKILSRIADGFMKGYINDNVNLLKCLLDEYILWILLEAYEHYETLNKSELDPKTLQQMGDKEMIMNRLTLCLNELEKLSSPSLTK